MQIIKITKDNIDTAVKLMREYDFDNHISYEGATIVIAQYTNDAATSYNNFLTRNEGKELNEGEIIGMSPIESLAGSNIECDDSCLIRLECHVSCDGDQEIIDLWGIVFESKLVWWEKDYKPSVDIIVQAVIRANSKLNNYPVFIKILHAPVLPDFLPDLPMIAKDYEGKFYIHDKGAHVNIFKNGEECYKYHNNLYLETKSQEHDQMCKKLIEILNT